MPAAYEKQGSAKLEKAEILQMTVDHLKILNQKGNAFSPFALVRVARVSHDPNDP